jgi:hypothetical protein
MPAMKRNLLLTWMSSSTRLPTATLDFCRSWMRRKPSSRHLVRASRSVIRPARACRLTTWGMSSGRQSGFFNGCQQEPPRPSASGALVCTVQMKSAQTFDVATKDRVIGNAKILRSSSSGFLIYADERVAYIPSGEIRASLHRRSLLAVTMAFAR